MPKTKNLALELITDETTLFKEFREKLCGEGEGTEASPFSNMQIVDQEIGNLKEKINNMGDVVTASIIDVDALPTEDIKTNVFYRLNGVIYAYKDAWIEIQNALDIGTTTNYDKESDTQVPTTKLVAALISQLGGGGSGTGGGGTGEGGIAAVIVDVEELPSVELAAENVLYRTKTENFIGWFGQAVPSGTQIETIYFNKELSTEEVIQAITNAAITYDENKYYVVKTETKAIIIKNENDIITITNNEEDVVYFHNSTDKETELGFIGWNPNIDNVEINEEALRYYTNANGDSIFYGEKNGFLSTFIAITPIEKGVEVITQLHHFKNGKQYDLQNNIEKELYDLWEILIGDELEEEYPKPTVEDLVKTKQDKLIVGAGVTITEDNVISVRPGLSFKIVDSLPSTGDSTYIYLVPNNSDEQTNIYEEYVWVEDSRFELIGSTQVDLSGYYTKEEVDELLENIDLSAYYTKTETDTKFNSYYNKTQVDSKFTSYYTKTETDTKLGTYYNKTEVDNLLANKIDKSDGLGLSENNLTDELVEKINNSQIKLKAGNGITIAEDGTISLALDIAEEGSY